MASSTAAPTVYPYTILVAAPGTKVARCLVTNAFNFLDIESGRVMAQDLFIGAFHNGINVDHAYDHVTLRHLVYSIWWDIEENLPWPQPIDNWMINNLIALQVGRADSLEVGDMFTFSAFIGMLLTDSPDTSQNPTCGTGSDFDLEGVQYGIVVTASNTPGYKFTNVDVQAACTTTCFGQAVLQVKAGGSLPPKIEINGGSVGESWAWALGEFPPPGPDTIVVISCREAFQQEDGRGQLRSCLCLVRSAFFNPHKGIGTKCVGFDTAQSFP